MEKIFLKIKPATADTHVAHSKKQNQGTIPNKTWISDIGHQTTDNIFVSKATNGLSS